jgi:hypothetical protein
MRKKEKIKAGLRFKIKFSDLKNLKFFRREN